MKAIVAMLRGVNLLGRNRIRMEDLRSLCGALKLENAQTYLQSGNVVFRCNDRDHAVLAKEIEDAIEKKLGFRPAVVLRTTAEMRDVIARNPFAKRKDVEGSKLLVTFFSKNLSAEVQDKLKAINPTAEEIHVHRRELYIYFPDGVGHSKLPAVIDRVLKKTGTARNWNSVMKLLEMAEMMEAAQ